MLKDTYTSTGHKFFAHQEAMKNLRNGKGQPIVTHVMLTDVCNHSCAFCSVQARAGDSLPFDDVMAYLDTLIKYGLKAVILSGGGNPILYKNGGRNFNDVVDAIHERGLEIGLITNGMPLRQYQVSGRHEGEMGEEHIETIRESWGTVSPKTLDKLTWIRISMSGLDHDEREVYVPDVDPTKTTLGFSYVGHDIYNEPLDPHHGKVSTRKDLISVFDSGTKRHDGSVDFAESHPNSAINYRAPDRPFEGRIGDLTSAILHYSKVHHPRYVRLLPNCLEPELIPQRCKQLQDMANFINFKLGEDVVFVQNKPPRAPKACYLGYIHPVLNADGFIYPCDSCVLNEAANHQFANPWRMCHWSKIHEYYDTPVHSLITDPKETCPGCVFTGSNELLIDVRHGRVDMTPTKETPEHVNFV